ncbi:MAG: hypothetical protein HEQ23_09640 [Tepidisphaera sp.]
MSFTSTPKRSRVGSVLQSVSFLVVFMLALFPSGAHAQQKWYIHGELGDDSNSGLSSAAPLRTLHRFELATGRGEVEDRSEVLMAGTFRESLILNMDFAAPARTLTFRQWTENDPNVANLKLSQAVLRGDKPVRGWTRAGKTHRYVATVPAGLALASVVWNWDVNIDNRGRHLAHLVPVTSIALVETTPYSWFYTGTQLHINVSSASGEDVNPGNGEVAYVPYGENGGLTISRGVGCVIQGLHSYLWLNDFQGSYGFSQEHSVNGSIVECVTVDTSHHGIGFTGETGEGNSIIGCVVSGLMGLRVDNTADAFGFLSSGNTINSGLIEDCIAHCYSLMRPDGQPLNPSRNIHGFRCGTSSQGQFIRNLDIRRLTVYSYFPACGDRSTPFRITDAAPPTNPLDPSTYGVRFDQLRVERGGVVLISGDGAHASFVNSTIDLSDCARRNQQYTGAFSTNFGFFANNHVLLKNSRVIANVDDSNGAFWVGCVFMLKRGLSLYLVDSAVDEVGMRTRGSTATMFRWFDTMGRLYVRGTTFTFRYPFGVKRLCMGDTAVAPVGRDFDFCRYVGLSNGPYYTEWYGPSFGLPDIRSEAAWLSNDIGDTNGTASAGGLISPSGSTVAPGSDEHEDDRPR